MEYSLSLQFLSYSRAPRHLILNFTPRANLPTCQPLLCATEKLQRVTACTCWDLCVLVCVLPRPWASLTPIKNKGRETYCSPTGKRWLGGTKRGEKRGRPISTRITGAHYYCHTTYINNHRSHFSVRFWKIQCTWLIGILLFCIVCVCLDSVIMFYIDCAQISSHIHQFKYRTSRWLFTLNKICKSPPTITHVDVLSRGWVDMAWYSLWCQ